MNQFRIPWGLTCAILITTYLHSICASASQSINVALKTSFSSAPYLLELLETAGDENRSSYFPLLDRIADGTFAGATTEKNLYDKFIKVLKDDGHMDGPALSSYKLALSLHSTAPRIEAHYHYYHTFVEPSLKGEEDPSCQVWALFDRKKYCTPSFGKEDRVVTIDTDSQLQFDRVLGNVSAPASVLYADISSPKFGEFHRTLIRSARDGKTSYRVRHRLPETHKTTPLVIGGYGVELALKRTDYIVIDDRKGEDSKVDNSKSKAEVLGDEELADLKPLSTSELHSLSSKASAFVMQSNDPFEMLVKLSQDFPKFSSLLASQNISTEFIEEHTHNRQSLVPSGVNVLWINGVQIIERQIDAFTLLDLLRQERKLISGMVQLGFSGQEAISLLSHPKLGGSKPDNEPQRYDWRDEIDGGNVIIWLNDIEKDKRYAGWSKDLKTLLQRTFPGQLPSVRRDMFNIILPVNFSVLEDVELVVEQIQNFVKRALPLRFGLVPLTNSTGSIAQAKIVYYILDSYGISTTLGYLETILATKHTSNPSKSSFENAINGRSLRRGKQKKSLEEILDATEYEKLISNSQKWLTRLAADGTVSSLFVNGAVIPRDESWLQTMSTRVNTDLQAMQRAVYEGAFPDGTWPPMLYLSDAVARRNPLIVPEDEKSIRSFDIGGLLVDHGDAFKYLPLFPIEPSAPKADWTLMVLAVDLSTKSGQRLLSTASEFRASNPGIELIILNSCRSFDVFMKIIANLEKTEFQSLEGVEKLKRAIEANLPEDAVSGADRERAQAYWTASMALLKSVGLQSGQNGLLINGRLVGPILSTSEFDLDDFDQLLKYERTKRISPVYAAMESLGLSEKITDPLVGAKISSIVAMSLTSDIPEGIYEQAPKTRHSKFDEWKSEHTSIKVGDPSTALLRITATIDPATEQAQRWSPILKVLSELDGVYLRIFMNPKEQLLELPVKRFYRYVLDSEPKFNDDGNLMAPSASFSAVPQEALLTVGMDVPPPWLVAPKDSIHDLDNIKLSNVKGDVDAMYELEHILIEGHSRQMPGGEAPRGAQLLLGTARDPHFADTIIMANLGYFQFKANPGFYKISLQKGRSAEIFKIDSLGLSGFKSMPGDDATEVAVMSFQGTTLYPRLSRNPGQETEDVLDGKVNSTKDFVAQGLKFAENYLGFGMLKANSVNKQADINIFSVASGHLYERMLNIMMVSVMKHTKSTVKFWFIEQFLSPSFKDFIPHLAAEYGFQYEMVTYKWPHWLREQKEKQREIWGYKILFLDVLFPLSLDKVIFVDADQIVRTDMIELVNLDLKGAPYGFTPMCDSRTEMEGFRFWKQGYWKNFLKGLPYHISALYVVDLRRFRQIAAGDRLRQQYHTLSSDPGSLANLDQDLPNHMQQLLPIHSLPQEWLWCETWCSDDSLKEAKTIDLCNNPLTKEPKLDRARRQVPEWTVYDEEITMFDRKRKGNGNGAQKNPKSRTMDVVPTARKVDEL